MKIVVETRDDVDDDDNDIDFGCKFYLNSHGSRRSHQLYVAVEAISKEDKNNNNNDSKSLLITGFCKCKFLDDYNYSDIGRIHPTQQLSKMPCSLAQNDHVTAFNQ
ncbi:hypothetical protein ABEB36_008205 [Hypothenemus hampei]|uniref:Uncharacterized protein n=1 Tax=Hypothenemus hampei TaxID=57062 RepID=A0ABD1EL66_HYPHA